MSTKYTHSISGDFPNQKVDTTRLIQEINDNSIIIALDYINVSGDDCDVWFKADLSSVEQTTLSGIIAAHGGQAMTSTIQVSLSEEKRDPAGKLRIQETSRAPETKTYFTSSGDDPTNVNDVGGGERLMLHHTISGSPTSSVIIDLNIVENETWIHEGYLTWKNCNHDEVIFEIIPRTVDYTASSGTYYNIYGGYLVIPAAGDGTIQITSDITTHSGGLIYIPLDEDETRPTAFWNADWNTTTKEYENISAAPAGNGEYNMFTVPVTLSRFANKISLLDNGFIMLQSADSDQLGHGMRLKLSGMTCTCDEYGHEDHDWSVAGIITFHRKKSC